MEAVSQTNGIGLIEVDAFTTLVVRTARGGDHEESAAAVGEPDDRGKVDPLILDEKPRYQHPVPGHQ